MRDLSMISLVLQTMGRFRAGRLVVSTLHWAGKQQQPSVLHAPHPHHFFDTKRMLLSLDRFK